MKDQLSERLAGLPDIYNLPYRGVIVAAQIAKKYRLSNVLFVAISDHPHDLRAKDFHSLVIKNHATVQITVVLELLNLRVSQHNILIYSLAQAETQDYECF